MKTSTSLNSKNTHGFGLIEILIAVALIAGLGFIVSEFVLTSSDKQIDVRSAAACQVKLSAALSKIKESDNNSKIDNWLPKSNELTPPDTAVAGRLKSDIVDNYNGATPGEVLALANAISINPAAYTTNEVESARLFNNFQLIASATSILSQVYPEACNTAIEGPALPDGQLKDILETQLGGLEGVTIQVQKVTASGTPACDADWQAVPINTNPNASINNNELLALNLTAEFEDETADGDIKTCTANATFSQGSDLVAPDVQISVTPLGTLTNVGGVYCGATGSTASFQITIQQPAASAEFGVQYLCRLDYVQGNLNVVTTRHSGTGWFICSMPEASVEKVETNLGNASTRLTVPSVDASSNTSLTFTIGNAAEGSYRLHVKSVDVARNESITRAQDIQIDLNRPSLINTFVPPFANSTTANLEPYHFQCSDRAHSQWLVQNAALQWVLPSGATSQIAETIEVTNHVVRQRYVNFTTNVASYDANFSCSNVDVNLGANNWAGDGPKLAQIVVCDACNSGAGDTSRNLNTYLWFVDTINFGALGAATLNSSARFEYNAGQNNNNPYIISQRTINGSGTVSSDTWSAVNTYDANRQLTNVASSFQSNQQSIANCSTYGRYEYNVQDGCGRNPASPSVNTYTASISGPSECDRDGTSVSNIRYCPDFVSGTLVAGNPQACSLINAAYRDCSTMSYSNADGLCGARPPGGCEFVAAAHRACETETICPSGYVAITSGPYAGNCSRCSGIREVVVNTSGGAVTTLADGSCPNCNDPTPCLHSGNCWKLRKCNPTYPNTPPQAFIQNNTSGGGVTQCGVSYSFLSCAETSVGTHDGYYARIRRVDDPTTDPVFTAAEISDANRECDPVTPTPSPSPTASATPEPSPTASATPDPSPSASPSPTPENLCWAAVEGSLVCGTAGACTTLNETRTSNCETTSGQAHPNTILTCSPDSSSCVEVADPSGGCFIAGTPVQMADGTEKAIETINEGDEVLTFDEDLNETRKDIVTEIASHETKLQMLFTFEMSDGRKITSNDIHPIYVKNLNRYISSKDIYTRWLKKKNIELISSAGKTVTLKHMTFAYSVVPVYNLHVKGITEYHPIYKHGGRGHNYFVNGILVHNRKCTTCDLPPTSPD